MAKTSSLLNVTNNIKSTSKEIQIVQEDVFKRIFGIALSRMIINRPILILARKPRNKNFEYIELLKRLLRELYRIYVGGLPSPVELRTTFEEVKLNTKAGKHIYVIDVDEVFREGIKDAALKYIVDRLREFYSQGFGFLVFYGSKERLDDLWYRTISFNGKLFGKTTRPLQVSIREDIRLYILANLIWGKIIDFEQFEQMENIDLKRIEEVVDLDSYVVALEEDFYRKIIELVSDPDIIIKVEPSKRDEEKIGGESLLHYGVKAFVVKYLIEYENVPDYNIFTEYEVGDIVLDVFVKHPKCNDLAIEVEILYGTALLLLKLRKTIESRLNKGLRLWIIIPNPQFVLFLKDLAKLRYIYKERYQDSIEFFTLDIHSRRLVSFPEFIEKIRRII